MGITYITTVAQASWRRRRKPGPGALSFRRQASVAWRETAIYRLSRFFNVGTRAQLGNALELWTVPVKDPVIGLTKRADQIDTVYYCLSDDFERLDSQESR